MIFPSIAEISSSIHSPFSFFVEIKRCGLVFDLIFTKVPFTSFFLIIHIFQKHKE
nr:MAG TPA: hypothetical protein [Caudoviricetes sp.]